MLKASGAFIVGAIVTLLILALFAGTFGPSFKGCVRKKSAQHSEQTAPDNGHHVVAFVTVETICTLSLIDRHSSFFSFLATIVIAAFTATLWSATRDQASMTKETLVADKRAFLNATNLVPQWERDSISGYYNWRMRPQWINSGDTPSRNLRLYAGSEFRDSPLPDDFVFTERLPPGTGMLGPHASSSGGAVPHPPGIGLTPDDIVAIRDGKKFFYMWGWVRYFDVFPGTDEHITRFCWQITVAGDPTRFLPGQVGVSDTNLAFGYLHAPKGNCADDECKG